MPSPFCKHCKKAVYPNDPQINLDGSVFHKTCAKCGDCHCQITLSNFSSNPDKTLLLCKTHYLKRFKEGGSYLGDEKFTGISSVQKRKEGGGGNIKIEENDHDNRENDVISSTEITSKDSHVPHTAVSSDAVEEQEMDTKKDVQIVLPHPTIPTSTTTSRTTKKKTIAQSTSATKVRVCVRIRPLTMREARGRRCLNMFPDRMMVGEKVFTFDDLYDEHVTQRDIYRHCIANLIDGCFEGFNATVFAYGQTGSGKTHTMIGNGITYESEVDEDDEDDEQGVIPRAVRHIFQLLQHKSEETPGKIVSSVHVSFIEIYNDECKDLLHPDIASRDIYIREDKEGHIFMTGAREEEVHDASEALVYLERGNLSRTTAETLMNSTSSRSHAIFTLALEMYDYSGIDDETGVEGIGGPGQGLGSAGTGTNKGVSVVQSKVHLVDLAGSERAKRTGAGGLRLKESVGINQGLLALGKVIRALTTASNSSSQAAHAHVPYRESKLTRFLQDSLGGNSRTVMLACVSPAEINLHETLSTLQYASRARAVQNKLIANVATIALPPPPPGPLPPLPSSTTFPSQELSTSMNEMNDSQMYEEEKGETEGELALVRLLRSQLLDMQQEMKAMKQRRAIQGDVYMSVDGGGDMGGSNGEGGSSALVRTEGPATNRSPVVVNRLRRSSAWRDGNRKSVSASMTGFDHPMMMTTELSTVQATMEEVCKMLRTGLDGVQGLGQEACGRAWKVVEASRVAVTRLESMLTMSSTIHSSQQKQQSLLLPPPPSTMRASLADALGEIAKEEEIMSLRRELQECREDLLRDEDIFATKVRELKSYRKQIRQLQQENADLLQQQQQQQQSYRRSQPSSLEDKHGYGVREEEYNHNSLPTTAASAVTTSAVALADKKGFWDKKIAEAVSKQSSPAKEILGSKETHMDKGYPDHKRGSENDELHHTIKKLHPIADEKESRHVRDKDLDRDREREREAALDLSYCLEVAATEPDISQLMEDLEATKSDEMKYRQAAARLGEEVERWRSEAATIREENQNLTKQLQQLHNQKDTAPNQGHIDADDEEGIEEGVDVRVMEERNEKEATEHYTDLRRQFETIANIHLLQKEMLKLQQQLRTTNKEKRQMGKEREVLMEQEKVNRAALLRQLGEINNRIDKQRNTVNNLSSITEGSTTTTKKDHHPDHNDRHDKEHQSAVRMLRNYEEHREELEDRLEQPWALSEDGSLRLQELIEELETLDTETKVTSARLKTEQERMKSLRLELTRGGGVGNDDDGDDYAGASFDAEEAEEVDKDMDNANTDDDKVPSVKDKDPSLNKMRQQMREMVIRAVNHVMTIIANKAGKKARTGSGTGTGKLHSSRDVVGKLLVHLSEAIVQTQYQTLSDVNEVGVLRTLLDESSTALETQLAVAHRLRSEHQTKMAITRKENDDKVAYLLLQLKNCEQKIESLEEQPPQQQQQPQPQQPQQQQQPQQPTSSQFLRPPQPSSSSSSSLPIPPSNSIQGGQIRPFTPQITTAATSLTPRHNHRPGTPLGPGTHTPASIRRLTDAHLSASLSSFTGGGGHHTNSNLFPDPKGRNSMDDPGEGSGGRKSSGSGGGDSGGRYVMDDGLGGTDDDMRTGRDDDDDDDGSRFTPGLGPGSPLPLQEHQVHLVDEVQRRWEAERERREQMEKRNTELTRELRSMREALRNKEQSTVLVEGNINKTTTSTPTSMTR